jgi:hypothetical protein
MYGAFNHPHLPHQGFPIGVNIGHLTVISGGANVHFVRSIGAADYDPPELAGRIHTTLNSALGQCRSGRGDTVLVLEGHTESIDSADEMSSLVAGTRIIGRGVGNSRPTFTWTAAGSTFLFDVANVSLSNCVLNMDPGTGTTNVAAPITISAAGCGLYGNKIRMGTDSNSKVTVGILLSDAADDCEIVGNAIYGATTAEATTFVDIAGADRLFMANNTIQGATSSTTVGIVRFKATAATNIWLEANMYANRKASSVHAVTGVAGVTGFSRNELFHMLDDAATLPWGTSNGSMAFYNPRNVNLAGEAGMLSTLVST